MGFASLLSQRVESVLLHAILPGIYFFCFNNPPWQVREGKGEGGGLGLTSWSDSGDGKRGGLRASGPRQGQGPGMRETGFLQRGLRKKFEEQTKD